MPMNNRRFDLKSPGSQFRLPILYQFYYYLRRKGTLSTSTLLVWEWWDVIRRKIEVKWMIVTVTVSVTFCFALSCPRAFIVSSPVPFSWDGIWVCKLFVVIWLRLPDWTLLPLSPIFHEFSPWHNNHIVTPWYVSMWQLNVRQGSTIVCIHTMYARLLVIFSIPNRLQKFSQVSKSESLSFSIDLFPFSFHL